MYKKCKVVMLSASNSQVTDENQIFLVSGIDSNTKYPLRISTKPNSPTSFRKECVRQHLYILSDNEIKYDASGYQDVELGEQLFDINENIVGRVSHIGGAWNFKGTLQFPKDDDLHNNRHCTSSCRRVIASTDPSLSLPSITSCFIQSYIEAYNKEEQIKEAEVVYELDPEDERMKHTQVIPIVRNNLISLKPLKQTWTREEVIEIIKEIVIKDRVYQDRNNTFISDTDDLYKWLNCTLVKWIESNL